MTEHPLNRRLDDGEPTWVRSRVTSSELRFLLTCAARRPVLFLACRERLTTDLFDPAEAEAVLFWRALTAVADSPGLPSVPAQAADLVAVQAHREAASDPHQAYYRPGVLSALYGPQGWIAQAFLTPEPGPEFETYAFDILRRLLEERLVADPLFRALATIGPGETVASSIQLFREYERRAAQISGVGADPGFDPVVGADYRLPAPNIFPTGLSWLDQVMGGGHAPGEAYLVLGPTSGGKTCFLVQLAVEGARIQAAAAAGTGRRRAWVYFAYEPRRDEMRSRILAYGARVSSLHTLLATNPADRELSTSDRLKDYEREPIVNPGPFPVGERERVDALNRELAGGWLRVVDYSAKVESHGTGGVPEIARYCQSLVATGTEVAGVVIDYAGLVVSRYRRSQMRMRPSDDYEMLATFGDEIRNQVAIPFNCPVWAAHQFGGDVGTLAPGARLNLSQGRGGRNLGDNVDFAFGIGNRDKKSKLTAFWVLKTRRFEHDGSPVITRFDSRFGAFLAPDGDYCVDPYTREIVERRLSDDFVFGDAPAPPPGL